MKPVWGLILFISISVTVYGIKLSTIRCQLPTANCQLSTNLNRQTFYKAMQENNKELVNAQLEELKTAPEELREAFLGAMMMKRASFVAAAGVKLHYFREGRKMLESAIKKDPDNAEYRFLRLMIQEHIPPALGYRGDIQKDSELIRKSYKSMTPEIQQFIADYNKKSKFLKLDLS
jgi:hypothetical protein